MSTQRVNGFVMCRTVSVVCGLVAKLCLTLFVTPWPVTCQTPLSMEFPRQEYWSWLPFPSTGGGGLPNPGIEPKSPALQADSLPLSHLGSPGHYLSYSKLLIKF